MFNGQIEIIGINPYVFVSKERAEQLQPDWRKPMPVLVQVNGVPSPPWHINMMPVGDGSFYLYLAEVVRKASRTKVGDIVNIRVTFDPDYKSGPIHNMPPQMVDMLTKHPKVQAAWDALIPSRQKEVLRYFANLKSDTALERNLEKLLYVLSGNTGRFMAREWKDGK